uniref:Uncharacterized protein n=1 Tax=Anguilla anguilla TaxID=7936 RepID=A0A0E9WD13_ANGAN
MWKGKDQRDTCMSVYMYDAAYVHSFGSKLKTFLRVKWCMFISRLWCSNVCSHPPVGISGCGFNCLCQQ